MTIEEYFGTLQQSFVEIWKNHLQTDKYSDHKALNEYYDDIVDAVDKLIEDWMGIHGKVKDLTNTLSTEYDEPKDYLKSLKKFAKEGREELISKEDTELWSDVDDILGLIDSTLYKLKELDESVNTSSLSRYLKESMISEKKWCSKSGCFNQDHVDDICKKWGVTQSECKELIEDFEDDFGGPVEWTEKKYVFTTGDGKSLKYDSKTRTWEVEK